MNFWQLLEYGAGDAVTVDGYDVEHVAAGIAAADGEIWVALSWERRTRYCDLAKGAVEALGLEVFSRQLDVPLIRQAA